MTVVLRTDAETIQRAQTDRYAQYASSHPSSTDVQLTRHPDAGERINLEDVVRVEEQQRVEQQRRFTA